MVVVRIFSIVLFNAKAIAVVEHKMGLVDAASSRGGQEGARCSLCLVIAVSRGFGKCATTIKVVLLLLLLLLQFLGFQCLKLIINQDKQSYII